MGYPARGRESLRKLFIFLIEIYFPVEIIAFPVVLFHRNRFFNVCCLFRQRFSAAYLLKLFLLPQHAHTTVGSLYQG